MMNAAKDIEDNSTPPAVTALPRRRDARGARRAVAFISRRITRASRLFIPLMLLICCGMTCQHQKRTSIDETEKVRAVALQQAEQVVEPTPIVVETTTSDGSTTSVTAVPKSTTTYSLSDNTTASSESSLREWVSWQVGVPWTLCIALLLGIYVLWVRLSSVGNIVDTAGGYVINRLTQSNDPKEREAWHAMQNILDRK